MTLTYASKLCFKQVPANNFKSKCLSTQLMQANSLIASTSKGFFAFLPLGQRIVEKLTNVVEKELHKIGGQKCEVPSIGHKGIWEKSGRWNEIGSEMFKLNDRLKTEYCLQPTAEEMFTILTQNLGTINKKMLPLMLFQTSQKFRDEMNPRFGILRSKQFLMNDLYTFDLDHQTAEITYNEIFKVYETIFENILGFKDDIYKVQANPGAMGGNFSHEFHLPNPSAEDTLLICKSCGNQSKKDEVKSLSNCCKCDSKDLKIIETVEVGHTFQLGERYSKVFEANSTNGNPYFMCCFGLGITRIIAAAIDVLSVSNKAMRLPNILSPFKVVIILPKENSVNSVFVQSFINDISNLPGLCNNVLIDDRIEKSIGRRINEANQLGIPNILVASSHKHVDPFEIQTIEYFKTFSKSDKLEKIGNLTHSELFVELSKI
uniref:Proline--tRNA ligase n=1 Tax=Panagrolaimus sp. PS1159 TaxID=55785 RepID=A0AC35FP24_9BILA